MRQACNSQLTHVAAEVYPFYKQAPQNLDSNIAEKLLLAPDLSIVPSAIDPLGIVDKAGAATKIRADHPAMVSLMDYLRSRGEVDGRKLLDDFNRAQYGWFKDTTRYLVAGLFISQAVRIKVGGQWLEAVGPKATEALKNNNNFAKIDVATNDTQPDQEALNRAAKRLLELTGDKVLPMAQKVSQAVLKHFPAFRNEYASLAVELTSSCLPGSPRAQSLSKRLTRVLDRDASDAPATLGAEDSSLVDDLAWAREVRKALDNELGKDASEAAKLAQIHSAVLDRHKKRQEEMNVPPATNPSIVNDKGQHPPIPMKIRVRRRYTPADLDALEIDMEIAIGALTTGLNSLKSSTATEVSVELD